MTKYEPKYSISSQKVQVEVNVMKKLIEELQRGKTSTLMMRNIILQNYLIVKLEDSSNNNNNENDYLKELDHHSMVALDTLIDSISMLQSYDVDDGLDEKPKLSDHLDHHPCKSEVSFNQESPKCYKKRKIGGESREIEVKHLTDDGFAWRKYGQKIIHDYIYPRHYFRCTHKHEQKCQATKQVQQISENPTKYKLIYNNNHTCNNNNSPYMIDSPDEHSSAFVLSFDGSNPINPMLFPESAFHTTISDVNDRKIHKTSEASYSNTAVSEQSERHHTQVAENNNSSSFSSSSSTSLDLDMIEFSDDDTSELFRDSF